VLLNVAASRAAVPGPTISARDQFGLTRREIAGLLDTPPKSDRISVVVLWLLASKETMAIALNREMTRGPNGVWIFRLTRTREHSNVRETMDERLSHEVVVEIYRSVMGGVPATGLSRENVMENWDHLEPRLRAEIEKRIPSD
jgi:hypothetical protein